MIELTTLAALPALGRAGRQGFTPRFRATDPAAHKLVGGRFTVTCERFARFSRGGGRLLKSPVC